MGFSQDIRNRVKYRFFFINLNNFWTNNMMSKHINFSTVPMYIYEAVVKFCCGLEKIHIGGLSISTLSRGIIFNYNGSLDA